MRHASLLGLALVLSGAHLVGCSCSGTHQPTNHHDGGPNGNDDANDLGDDGNVVRPDAWFERPDTGPAIDTDKGCGSTTPVMNQIIGDPPDMLIVLDISGSMCDPPGAGFGMSKLAIMKSSLTTLVNAFDSRINWGLMEFPGPSDACAPGNLRVPVAPMNAANVVARVSTYPTGLFACAMFASGATPTFAGISQAQDYYRSIPRNPIGQYVLLATDGQPNCGAPTDSMGGTADTPDETVAAITALHGDGVNTFVLGFGGGLGSDMTTLNRMAVAGGTVMPYSARSATELDAALSGIAASIIPPTCTIMLDGGARDPSLFQVSFDGGALIPRDTSHASGWDYDSGTNTITFYGDECSQVEMGHVTNIGVDYGCPGPAI